MVCRAFSSLRCLSASRQSLTPRKFLWTAPASSRKRKREVAHKDVHDSLQSSSNEDFWIPKYKLTMNHKRRLQQMHLRLEDCHINAFQILISRTFASQGWQNVEVGHVGFEFAPAPSIQILHNINGDNHWLASASTSVGVLVADSLLSEPNQVICQQLLDLHCKPAEDWLDVTYLDVQRQSGGTQCGDFAIAFAAAFASGKSVKAVRALRFDQDGMRSHLLTCLAADQFSPFPASKQKADLFCTTHLQPMVYRIAKVDASHARQA